MVTNKRLLIDAINGARPDMDKCIKFEKDGIMKFTGNQHNPKWNFKQDYLEGLSPVELEKLYYNCRG